MGGGVPSGWSGIGAVLLILYWILTDEGSNHALSSDSLNLTTLAPDLAEYIYIYIYYYQLLGIQQI